ncbi:MAG: ABC transporter ATP-binding protein [Methanomassiliicoccales archaeon]|nr:MAG: ABC transporter ATP-binding protein [Methanomassiliicoccales archaeon]
MIDETEVVIETKNLSKRFKEVLAVDKLNMKVRKGEIFGFLGPNGAGKTTTIKMIMGLTHPTEGEVLIKGDKAGPNKVEIRRDMGFLPERISFYENLTPVQTLNFFCELKGCDKSIVDPLIADVGLEEAKNRKVGTFSKGMVQLLGVAQATIGNPSIYILDEPMGGLDARWVKMVRDKIIELNKKGATIIFSSHILSEVQNLCHRVAIIDKGKLVALDTIENLSELLQIKPRLEINIPGLDGNIPEGVEEIEGVEAVDAKDDVLYVTSDAGARAKVLALIEDKRMTVSNFKTVEPSLEETFVKLVSRKDKEVD